MQDLAMNPDRLFPPIGYEPEGYNDSLYWRRTEVFDAFSHYMNAKNMDDARRCYVRLLNILPYPNDLARNCILVAYGGGKDSSYMVAFVRLIQLLIFKEYGATFRLRIATNRHAGMPTAVMENMHRVYDVLGLYDDLDVELLLIDGNEVQTFDVNSPLPEHVTRRNRLDILMTGHRCQGDARPTFCNACNLSMVNSFGVAISHGDGIDVIITGDSMDEQRAYAAWIRRIARKFELPKPKFDKGFVGFLKATDRISNHYFSDIYGEHSAEIQARRVKAEGITRNPVFFSIYQDTAYQAGEHWEILTDFLGFRFDELAFSFTESDCANPALMAHLRGLKAQHIHARNYEEGIAEYVKFAVHLMRQKDFPEPLIETVKRRYHNPESIQIMRNKLARYAKEVYDLSKEQIICMLYSPFTQKGKHLSSYIMRETPELSPHLRLIHLLLTSPDISKNSGTLQRLEDRLTELSGLSLQQLRSLYHADLTSNGPSPDSQTPISIVLNDDPHKGVIETRHRPDGPVVLEMISGR
jgi:hypothetical protein